MQFVHSIKRMYSVHREIDSQIFQDPGATVAAEHGGESSKNIHNFGCFRYNGAEQLPGLIFAVSFSSLVIEIAAISEIMSLEKEI